MIRRSVLAAGALAIALTLSSTLSSCSTFTANDDVASVGDTSLSRDDFESYVRDLLAANAPTADHSQIAGEDARQIIARWVGDQLTIQFLQSNGVDVTDADRATVSTGLDAQLAGQGLTFGDVSRRIIIEGQAARAVFQNTQQPGALGPFAQDISIEIDSRYGFWDGETGTVVGFG